MTFVRIGPIRFNVAKLVIRIRALIIALGDLTIGAMVGFIPHWHSSTSLVKIRSLGLPWPVIGVVFIAAAVLVAFPIVRAWGYGATAVLTFVSAWSLADVSIDAPLANGIVTVGMFMLGGVLLCGVATAQVDRGRRDEP